MVQAGSTQLVWEFVAEVQERKVDDAFSQWLHDDKTAGIDWSTFGIEKIQSETSG